MISVAMGGYAVRVWEALPTPEDPGCTHASLRERFGTDAAVAGEAPASGDEVHLHVYVGTAWPARPLLCVAERYTPGHWAGCFPGLLLVPETALLFVGAGERLLAYDLRGPARLWEDRTDCGFHQWQRHGDTVVMAAELELAAWDLRGIKRWSTFVEPPWEYHVDGGTMQLDVMGTTRSFPVLAGPTRP